jgi:voltage-gated potassium channel
MARRLELPMLVAALLVIPVIILQESDISPGLRVVVDALNVLIWLAFVVEVVAMLWVVPNRKRWLVKHPLEIAIVLATGPFLPASLQSARALRALRVLRVLRLLPSARRIFSLDGVRIAAVLIVLAILGGGAVFHAIENGHNGVRVSLWDGVWWAASTVTTVGASDVFPHTTEGRVVAIALMFFGLSFVALVTGAAAQRFLSSQVEALAAGEEHIEADITAAGTDIVSELREVANRITEIEQRIAAKSDAYT